MSVSASFGRWPVPPSYQAQCSCSRAAVPHLAVLSRQQRSCSLGTAVRASQGPAHISQQSSWQCQGASWLQPAAAAAMALTLQCTAPSAWAQTTSATATNGLCDDSCQSQLESLETHSFDSGVRYKDIKVGTGAAPPMGFQATVDYVAMTDKGEVFDTSLDEQSKTYDVRVGSGEVCKMEVLGCTSARMCTPSCQMVAGLGEGIKGMRVGGVRRLYVPGKLSYQRGIATQKGRPNVGPRTPVMFDVQLRYVAGMEEDQLTIN